MIGVSLSTTIVSYGAPSSARCLYRGPLLPRRTLMLALLPSGARLARSARPRHVGVVLRRLAPIGQAVIADHTHAPLPRAWRRLPRCRGSRIAPGHQQQALSGLRDAFVQL